MPDSDTHPTSKVEEAAELVRRLCVTHSNVIMYSPQHPLALDSVRTLNEWLGHMAATRQGALVINVAGDSILVEDLPIETRNPIVKQFATRLIGLHVNNLHFSAGMTDKELLEFFKVMTTRPEDIEARGGIHEALSQAGVTHVRTSEATYVRVGEDEKIVARDAKIVNGEALEDSDADASIVRYMLHEVLQKSQGHEWFLTRVKNDPKEIAGLITRSIEQAIAHEQDDVSREDLFQALVQNIKTVAYTLAEDSRGQEEDEGAAEAPQKREQLQDALLVLEAELRTRSATLNTDRKSAQFINEILNVVAASSDKVKASRISHEFLKGEQGLKRTEELLGKLAGPGETPDQLLIRLSDYVVEKGVKKQDLRAVLDKTQKKPKPKRKKTYDKAVKDGIAQRLQKLAAHGGKPEETVEQLTTFMENKLKEKEKAFRQQTSTLRDAVHVRDDILDNLDYGILLWDAAGTLEHVNDCAADSLGMKTGGHLRPEMLAELERRSFPCPDITPDEAADKGWEPEEYRLLTSITTLIRSAAGVPVAALMKKG